VLGLGFKLGLGLSNSKNYAIKTTSTWRNLVWCLHEFFTHGAPEWLLTWPAGEVSSRSPRVHCPCGCPHTAPTPDSTCATSRRKRALLRAYFRTLMRPSESCDGEAFQHHRLVGRVDVIVITSRERFGGCEATHRTFARDRWWDHPLAGLERLCLLGI